MEPGSEQAVETDEESAGAQPGPPSSEEERAPLPPMRLSQLTIEMNVSRIASQIAAGRDATFD